MKTGIDRIVGLKQYKRKKKPVLYWNAISKYTGKLLASGSIALLRSEFGDSCDYKPVS